MTAGPWSGGSEDAAAATCVDCGCEYPTSYVDNVCIDCGGALQRPDGSVVEASAHARPGADEEWCLYLPRVAYLGGHPLWPDPIGSGKILLDEQGFAVWDSFEQLAFEVDVGDLVGLEVDGPQEVQRRVTVPRVLALGLIALAVPKRERISYLVATTGGGEVILECHSMTAMELRAAIQPLGDCISIATDSQDSSDRTRGTRERLIELNGLRDEGLVSSEEYASRRNEILNQI